MITPLNGLPWGGPEIEPVGARAAVWIFTGYGHS